MKAWIKAQSLAPSLLLAVILALIIRAFSFAFIFEEGGGNIEFLWLSIAITIPLLRPLSKETAFDLVAPRSLLARRIILLSIALLSSIILALILYPNTFWDFGLVALLKNCCAFLGLGLISRRIFGQRLIWVLPAFFAAYSMTFSWPTQPSTAQTAWGFLRSSGQLSYPNGNVDLSLLITLIVFLSGTALYLFDSSAPSAPKAGLERASTRFNPHSATLLIPGLILLGTVLVLISISSFGDWSMSPRLFLRSVFLQPLFLILPIAAGIGVVVGQTRWRTGTYSFEKTSALPQWRILTRPCSFSATGLTVLLFSVAAAGLALTSLGALIAGVSSSVIAADTREAAIKTALSILFVLLGAALGSLIGAHLKSRWVSISFSSLVFALFLAMPLSPALNKAYSELTSAPPAAQSASASATCLDIGERTLCANPMNVPFLPAAAVAVQEIIDTSPASQALPRTFYLVDSPYDTPPFPMAAVGLQGKRQITLPTQLDTYQARMDLSTSLSQSCQEVDISSINIALGLMELTPGKEMDDSAIHTCLDED